MTRWLYPPMVEPERKRVDFDPVVAGTRLGLSRELSLALWERLRAEATDAGCWDAEQIQRRFLEVTAVLARSGWLLPDVGRTTRVKEIDGDRRRLRGIAGIARGGRPLPIGRTTRVMTEIYGEVRGQRNISSLPHGSPGRTTLVTAETRAWDARHLDARSTGDGDIDAQDLGRVSDRARAAASAAEMAVQSPWLAWSDRATQVREVARLYRNGELGGALQGGESGLADAVAAALRDGAIVAPHPVDRLRENMRGLAADATTAGLGLGRAAARWLRTTRLAPVGQRAFAVADACTGGAARAWSDRALGRADAAGRRAMALRDQAAEIDAEDRLTRLSTSGGMPLAPGLRARMEALFGHGFSHVRIHTDDAATDAAQAAGARAVTIGSHIYFKRDQFAPGSEAGDRLLLHELTHVVQHDQGRLAPATSGRVELSSPSDPAEQEARAMETRVGQVSRATGTAGPSRDPLPSAAASRPHEAPKTGTRASAGPLDAVTSWAGDRIDDIKDWSEDKIAGLVAEVAPGLATLIKEGPGGLIKDALQPAISSWVGSITGGVNVARVAGQLKGSFTAAFAVLQGAKAGDPKCCEALVSGINAIRQIASAFMDNPVFDAIKSVFTKVSEIVGTIAKLVLGPAFEVVKTIVGGAWDAIKGIASTIQGWFEAVKNIAGRVFDWVAKKLGFSSGTGEGGLLDWLQNKAAEVWDQIKETLTPVIGPLKVIAGVLLLATGLPQIYAIIKYGPELIDAIKWLWANRNNPEAVKQNPGGIGGSILPKILQVGQSFSKIVKEGAAWLVEKFTAFASGALQLLGAITGIPLLGMARGFVQTVVDGAQAARDWASGAFTRAANWLEGLYHRIADFIKPYAEVLCSIAVAGTNPAMIPVILAGWAWRWLPDCIKPPLIDLLLDAVIAILRGLPSLPMLGPLWPLLKSGVIGFLGALRARDPQTKIKVTNKLAKIITGASPMFLFGFAKGLLKGVWDGIKMPFEAIWLIARGIGKAGDFFVALGRDADDAAAKQPAATPATATGAEPATQGPLPSVPAVIRAAEASSVVGGIVSRLNAQSPPPPPTGPGATAQPAVTNEYKMLGQEARRMGRALAGPSQQVASNFWPAVQELFSSSKGSSLDTLMSQLGAVWSAAKAAVASLGAKLANMICDFLMQDSAEETLGDTIGYLVGSIAFEALLDYFSAGTWTGAMRVLSLIAKFLNWPMRFLGEAMVAVKALGGFVLDGLKKLGGMIGNAGGALRSVTGAFRDIATKLGKFADDILAKFRGTVDDVDGAAPGRPRDHAGPGAPGNHTDGRPRDGDGKPKDGDGNGLSVAEKEALKARELGEALAISKSIAQAEDAGRVPGPAIATSLEALKARYRWINAYIAEPQGKRFEIFLIASRFGVIVTSPDPDDDPPKPRDDYDPRNDPPGNADPPRKPDEPFTSHKPADDSAEPVDLETTRQLPVRASDDPAMTVDEFINDFRAMNPTSRRSNDELRAEFAAGRQVNPETGRLVTPTRPRPAPENIQLTTDPERVAAWQEFQLGGRRPPCFPAGTLVHTPDGLRAIDTLAGGDQVLAWSEASAQVTTRAVVRTFRNWTQIIVSIATDAGSIDTTRAHRFWSVDGAAWIAAADITVGTRLRLVDGRTATVGAVNQLAAEESTFNLEIEVDHTYFVAPAGVLVHNEDESAFASRKAVPVEIYEVRNAAGEVIYVGQSVQGVDVRLGDHINDVNSALYVPREPGEPPIRVGDPRCPYRTSRVAGGTWTPYEAAVWEQHYIERNGGLQRANPSSQLLNRINAITPENFIEYRNFHNPC